MVLLYTFSLTRGEKGGKEKEKHGHEAAQSDDGIITLTS